MTLATFFFHKGGAPQYAMYHNGYTEVTWPATKFNLGGGTLSGNKWVAPCAGVLIMHATVWLTQNVRHDGYQNLCIKFTKNGGDVLAVPSTAAYGASVTYSGTNFGSGVDICEAGDQYAVLSYSLSNSGYPEVVADGNPAHTWWSGALLPLPPNA